MNRVPTPGSSRDRREHPWERARRLSFARWEAELRRTPYGHPVPDVVGFADTIEPPLRWTDSAETRRLFALSALPAGSSPTYLAEVPAGTRRPASGALVRLSRPLKRALPGSDSAYGELLIEAKGGVHPASWEEILGGVRPRAALSVVTELSELWRLTPLDIETLLLPIVGSVPWHGRPAGLNLHFEAEGWSLARHRKFLSGILDLVPEWVGSPLRRSSASDQQLVLVSGAKIRRRGVARPFAVQVRPISAPPAAASPANGTPRSVLTYGSALASEFESMLSAGETTLLLSAEEATRVPHSRAELPDNLRATVWGLHWWTPEPPDAPELHRWLRTETSRLRHALETLPVIPPHLSATFWSATIERREFRERLVQTAFARARLRGAAEVEEGDLSWAVDSIIRAVQRSEDGAGRGSGPWARVIDRTEGGRTTRMRRTLEALFHERGGGLTPEEASAVMATRGVPSSARDVENQLERLRIRGVLFQDRTGRYQLV